MTRSSRWVPFAVVLSIWAGAACSSAHEAEPPKPPPDELEMVPFSTTRILDASDLKDLRSDPDGTLTFSKTPPVLEGVEVGTVIVAGLSPSTPAGLLRAVYRVERNGDSLVLHTAVAPIQVAFRKLHVKFMRETTPLGAAQWSMNDLGPTLVPGPSHFKGDARARLPLDFLLYDADGDSKTTNDQIAVKGGLGGGFTYELAIDVDWGEVMNLPDAFTNCIESLGGIFTGDLPSCSLTDLLPEVKLAFEVGPHMDADIDIRGSASLSYEKSFELASINLSPIPIGPLVFLPTVDIIAKLEGSATAGFVVSARGAAQFSTSVQISTKTSGTRIVPFAVKKLEFGADDTQVTLNARAKAGVGARLNLQLYGIVGPNAAARAYAQVGGDIHHDPCWDVRVGLEGEFGIKVSTPTLPVLGSVTLVEWSAPAFTAIDEEVASGSCLPIPKGPQLPPGSGPNGDSLSNPSFEPWAATIENVLDDGVVSSPTGNGRDWIDLGLAIDGRYVVAGSRSDSLVKLDDEGRLMWSRRYRGERQPLSLLRVAHGADASMTVLANEGSSRASLLQIGQSGGVRFRKELDFGAGGCNFDPVTVVRDGGSGYYVVGTCALLERAAVIHVDLDGNVLGARLVGDASGTRWTVPTTAAAAGSDVLVLGTSGSAEEGTAMFAVRLGDAGAPIYSKRYQDCRKPATLAPLSVHVQSDGQTVVAGLSANNRAGMLARLRADGSVASSGFQQLNGDDYFFLTSFAELPTTGFVATATLSTFGGEKESGLAVVWLDAVGRPLHASRYIFPDRRETSLGALRLTNDGGAFVAAMTKRPTPASTGGLLGFKAFAWNGSLEGETGIAAEGLAVTDLPCVMTEANWDAVVEEVKVTFTGVPTVEER